MISKWKVCNVNNQQTDPMQTETNSILKQSACHCRPMAG
jgi:hypothetical protein